MKNNSSIIGSTNCSSSNNSSNGSNCGNKPISTAAANLYVSSINSLGGENSSSNIIRSETNIGNSCRANCSDQLSSIIKSFPSSNIDSIPVVRLGLNLGIGSSYGRNIITSTSIAPDGVEAPNSNKTPFLPTTAYKSYPAINSAYWLPSPNSSPYSVPGMFLRLTVADIVDILENEEDIINASVYICPPENHMLSDGDSDEDDAEAGNFNHLSGNQLRAEGQLQIVRQGGGGLKHAFFGRENQSDSDDSDDNVPLSELKIRNQAQ
ncbi:PREDICTED: uncharacterized protein LOC108368943, partial [Rhagoletis zephyria]|uniref:uncharacterized protein LOC108368943 n=1 Tax=Rhagoletis zephyria TaxID=28612 RepID=UPI00081184C9